MSHCLIGVELGLQLVRWVVSSLLQSAWQASRRDRLVEAADAHAAPDGLPVTKPAGRPPCARQQGVAFSAMRHVVERVSTGEPTLLPRYGALGSALSYDLYNVVNGALAGRFEYSLSRLCYETHQGSARAYCGWPPRHWTACARLWGARPKAAQR